MSEVVTDQKISARPSGAEANRAAWERLRRHNGVFDRCFATLEQAAESTSDKGPAKRSRWFTGERVKETVIGVTVDFGGIPSLIEDYPFQPLVITRILEEAQQLNKKLSGEVKRVRSAKDVMSELVLFKSGRTKVVRLRSFAGLEIQLYVPVISVKLDSQTLAEPPPAGEIKFSQLPSEGSRYHTEVIAQLNDDYAKRDRVLGLAGLKDKIINYAEDITTHAQMAAESQVGQG